MPIIKLPRKNLISISRKSITVSLPDKRIKRDRKIDFALIKRAEGLWKNKKINGVTYQRKIRAEWD